MVGTVSVGSADVPATVVGAVTGALVSTPAADDCTRTSTGTELTARLAEDADARAIVIASPAVNGIVTGSAGTVANGGEDAAVVDSGAPRDCSGDG